MVPNTDTNLPWRVMARLENGRVRVIDSGEAWAHFTRKRPRVTALWTEFPNHEGVAVFSRPDPPRNTLARAMQQNGVRTVAETDDNYFCDSKHNLFLREFGYDAARITQHAKAMVRFDANVFSTVWLRDRYHRQYRDLFGNVGLPEMHVCRNHMPLAEWPAPADHDGPLRVGFMGSPSHVWDVNLAYAAIHAAHTLGCETVMIGYNPANPDPDKPDVLEIDGQTVHTRSERSKAVRATWQRVVTTHVPWVAPENYHREPLPLDIGLCPLLYNDFTLGKSDVKSVEYSVSGAAVVAQNHPIYTQAGWVHERNCLLAGSQEEMGLATVRLIRDRKLRAELVQNAQAMVREQRNEEAMKREWRAALGL